MRDDATPERPISAETPATLGVVLAGGLGRRMGGGDKPLRLVDGRSMLDRVIERFSPQCAAIVLNANGDPARFEAFGLTVVPDGIADHAGPLAGVLAGLDWCAENRPDLGWVATVAGDTPFLPVDFVTRLHRARIAAGRPIACATSGGRDHPVDALWPVTLRDGLRAALAAGERKVARWAAGQGIAEAAWGDEAGADPFFNVNDAADLDAADAMARAARLAPPQSNDA